MESSIETKPAENKSSAQWSSPQVYTMAGICLAAGLLVGYFVRGGQQSAVDVSQKKPAAAAPVQEAPAMPSMDQMKHMAEKSAEPLQEQLKAKPNDAGVLAQLAKTYFSTHQFPEAISYAEKAVQADPKHVGNRADLATYLYVSGQPDKALTTLEDALKLDANNPQVLFNIGMMKLRAKNDSAGAVAAWKQLLKNNPKLPEDRKKAVENAIAAATAKPAPDSKN